MDLRHKRPRCNRAGQAYHHCCRTLRQSPEFLEVGAGRHACRSSALASIRVIDRGGSYG